MRLRCYKGSVSVLSRSSETEKLYSFGNPDSEASGSKAAMEEEGKEIREGRNDETAEI